MSKEKSSKFADSSPQTPTGSKTAEGVYAEKLGGDQEPVLGGDADRKAHDAKVQLDALQRPINIR